MNTKIGQKQNSLPEILYEAPAYAGEATSPIPYILCDKASPMPASIFLFEYFETGEVEPDDKGKAAAIIDQIPHQFVDMSVIKTVLTAKEFDRVRVALGMMPLKEAKAKGKIVLDKVMAKKKDLEEEALETQNERVVALKEAIDLGKKQANELEKKKELN